MIAPLRLTYRDALRLSLALEALSKITREQHVRFDPFQPLDVQITNQTTVSVKWAEDEGYGEYVVDDRNGS